jgi:hypothetical protein
MLDYTNTRHGAETMTQAQMIEGTAEEITRQIQQDYSGQKLRVFIEPEEVEDLSAGIPDPPFAVRDPAHLEEFLLAGLDSPTRPFTDETTEQIRQEVHRRHAARQKP